MLSEPLKALRIIPDNSIDGVVMKYFSGSKLETLKGGIVYPAR